mgnify:CR=1 FL=1
MKTILTTIIFCTLTTFSLTAQSTMIRVYEIFQQKCASCHSNANPQSGLDLEESGSTTQIRALKVRTNILNVTPANAHAEAKGYKYVVPGRSDKSFLFRKINLDLEPTISLHANEEGNMPPVDNPQLTDVEKEMIRQWILFGAPSSGQVIDEDLLIDYYSGNGQESFPDGPPTAPAEEDGFQIKMGPFFLEPGGEKEYFTKYKLEMPEDQDIDRIEIFMSDYSHHFIIYDFNQGGDATIPNGFRLDPDHNDIGLVTAVQEPTDLKLPQGTAFIWDKDLVLDLNSHYINYSAFNPYMAENYVNIYTKPAGTAAQEMHTELLVNGDIPIPNNGNEVTHTQQVFTNIGEVFIWGIMGHTHKYGTGYKVFKRLAGGAQGELIYDAACAQGVPGCISPFFDYRHIPIRYFEPLMPLTFNFQNGIIHEASWINDGPTSVNFGPTSDDEMMVLVLMYTEDTTGVITDLPEIYNPLDAINIYPNPVKEIATVDLPAGIGEISFRLFDATGKELIRMDNIQDNSFSFNRAHLPSGMYFYRIEEKSGRFKAGKLSLE